MTNQPDEESDRVELRLDVNEFWWGGAVADGQAMPFGALPLRRDLATNAGFLDDPSSGANQSAPLLLSSAGRYVWSDLPFDFKFDGMGRLHAEGRRLVVGQGEPSLAGAFRSASAAHFPASGHAPAALLFDAPQYNTWIEMPYHPTQQGVLDYVRGSLDAGLPPGVVMIDDRWSVDYGDWRFDPGQFRDPGAMISQLHDWGCRVMLWIVPFVSPDSATFRTLRDRGFLVRRSGGEPAILHWWNGYSAALDLTHPDAIGWLRAELDSLVQGYGVDGFKFDAGDLRHYADDQVTHEPSGAVGQCEAWARLGTAYEFNEFRACWKMAGQPLAQRLHDKPITWGAGGLASLIPEGIALGLLGHPYVCPDMIGGGELSSFGGGQLDQEQFVRYAQCASLFPMMQFSTAPSRVLDAEHLAAVTAAVRLRQELVPELRRLVAAAAATGEPILRPLAYEYDGYAEVRDQFLLGSDLLCAPVIEQGAAIRTVAIPQGRWQGAGGRVVDGPTTLDVPVTLHSIPVWRRQPG